MFAKRSVRLTINVDGQQDGLKGIVINALEDPVAFPQEN